MIRTYLVTASTSLVLIDLLFDFLAGVTFAWSTQLALDLRLVDPAPYIWLHPQVLCQEEIVPSTCTIPATEASHLRIVKILYVRKPISTKPNGHSDKAYWVV